MKLITTTKELEKEFRRLTREYREYYWTTAWAGAQTSLIQELLTEKDRIRKITVGIHFYQTHPDFIETFLNDDRVRFIQQPEGTFHPKLYLFKDENRWEVIVGSANFTTEALKRNTEASMLISNNDADSIPVFAKAYRFVNHVWDTAKVFTPNDLKNYRVVWKNQRQKIKSLSGKYGGSKARSKPIYEVFIVNRPWEEFMLRVRAETSHGLSKRLRVIGIAQELFRTHSHYLDMSGDERRFIAGIPNNLEKEGAQDWGFFGSMQGAGIYKNRIIENDSNISAALDQIPLIGQITRSHYENYIEFFSKTFSGNYLATATRLLCMKRPDTFICFDSKNRSALCKDFGITQSGMNYERYWDDVVERIYDSNWWQNPTPRDSVEEQVSSARAAFLDSLYYEE